MRNLHLHIRTEYDEESKEIFCCLERIQLKMADFQNHRRFTLRCLSKKVVPVSIRLKSQVKTPKGLQIIRRAEISLLNERIRLINNTINMLSLESDTCIRRLKEKLKEEDFQECSKFIEERREAWHHKTMARQKEKLKALCGKSKKATREVATQTTCIAATTCIVAKMTSQIRNLT